MTTNEREFKVPKDATLGTKAETCMKMFEDANSGQVFSSAILVELAKVYSLMRIADNLETMRKMTRMT